MALLDPTTFVALVDTNGVTQNVALDHIVRVAERPDGTIWIGVTNGGFEMPAGTLIDDINSALFSLGSQQSIAKLLTSQASLQVRA